MRRTLRLLVLVACLAAGLAGTASAAADDDPRLGVRAPALERQDAAPKRALQGTRVLTRDGVTRVLVGLHDGASAQRIVRRLVATGADVERLPELSAVAVSGVPAASVVQLLRGDAAVAYIEEDRPLTSFADPYDAIDPATGINYQWAYDAIAAGPAIAAVGGGSQFPVAVIDTGVDVAHPDLAGRIVAAYSAVDGGADVTDNLGHGTFVAGLISSIDGNAVGGKGAAGATNLIAVRASTPGGEFYESQLADAIVWATQAGAKVLNLSLGGPCPSGDLITSALDHAFAQGVLVVAAAGNNAELGNQPNCPAADLGGLQGGWGKGLSVGATRPDGQRAPFSTFNDNVSVAAPGGGSGDCRFGVFAPIPSTVNLWDGSCSDIFAPPEASPARWAYGEGTSFAAPLASATGALALQANPNLLPEQLAQVIKRSAFQTLGEGWNQQTGWGQINAAAAVDLARRFDTLEPQPQLVVKPGPKALTISADAVDGARESEEPSLGVTVTLERSRDGSTFEPWLDERPAPLKRTIKASRKGLAYWFRATMCDANLNCSVATVGPRRPQRVKPTVVLRTRKVGRERGRAIVTLKRVKGLKGRAKVILEQRTKRNFKPIARFKLAFGKTARRPLKLDPDVPLRVRARVQSTADWRGVRSRSVSIAAPKTS